MSVLQPIKTWATASSQNSTVILVLIASAVMSVIGQGAIGVFAITAASSTPGGEIFVTVAMVAAAAQLIGTLIGFLFGIPRTLQNVSDESSSSSASSPYYEGSSHRKYLVNTNLEQVSDWLTKILVGIGLTQLGAIKQTVTDIAAMVTASLNNLASAQPVTMASIVYFASVGFLIGYLFTRIYVSSVLADADVTLDTTIQKKIHSLIHLDFDVPTLSREGKELLKTILHDCEQGTPYHLPEGERLQSALYTALHELADRAIIGSPNGEDWHPESLVELTPIAQNSSARIVQELL